MACEVCGNDTRGTGWSQHSVCSSECNRRLVPSYMQGYREPIRASYSEDSDIEIRECEICSHLTLNSDWSGNGVCSRECNNILFSRMNVAILPNLEPEPEPEPESEPEPKPEFYQEHVVIFVTESDSDSD